MLTAYALSLPVERLDGRTVPSLDDVRAVAAPVLRHRVLLTFQAEADGITPDQVVAELLRD